MGIGEKKQKQIKNKSLECNIQGDNRTKACTVWTLVLLLTMLIDRQSSMISYRSTLVIATLRWVNIAKRVLSLSRYFTKRGGLFNGAECGKTICIWFFKCHCAHHSQCHITMIHPHSPPLTLSKSRQKKIYRYMYVYNRKTIKTQFTINLRYCYWTAGGLRGQRGTISPLFQNYIKTSSEERSKRTGSYETAVSQFKSIPL